MVHLEQRPATPPDADNLEPTRIGAEQRVELLVGAGTEAAHPDGRLRFRLRRGARRAARRLSGLAQGCPRLAGWPGAAPGAPCILGACISRSPLALSSSMQIGRAS